MDSFPAMRAVRARDLNLGDVIYGRAGSFPETWQLLKHPVTVTMFQGSAAHGKNTVGTPFVIDAGTYVLVEKEE